MVKNLLISCKVTCVSGLLVLPNSRVIDPKFNILIT